MTTACEYKDLPGIEAPKDLIPIRVSFDFAQLDSIPKSMRLAFYQQQADATTRSYTMYDIQSRDTVIHLTKGKYDVVAWNNDTEYNLISGHNNPEMLNFTTPAFTSFIGTSLPRLIDSLTHNKKVLSYPDYMVHVPKTTIDISRLRGKTRAYGEMTLQDTTLTIRPAELTVEVSIKLNNIVGLEYCRAIQGVVTNVAATRYIGTENLSEDTCTVAFPMQANKEDNSVSTKFYVADYEPTGLKNIKHRLLVFFYLNKKQVYVPLDISEEVARARRLRDYRINVDRELNIVMQDSIEPSGGMSADLEEWQNITVPINI